MARAKSSTRRKSSTTRRKSSTRSSSTRSASRRSGGTPGRKTTTRARSTRRSESRSDAVSLLKADHRQVEAWFAQFERARGDDRKRALAGNICKALRVHSQIEEEIFYPAFYEATGDEDLHHEAVIEHDSAKKLIAEIEASTPDDDYYEARVSVLSEMIRHHVQEEEQRDGMFAKARSSGMDLEAVGQQLAERKAELEASPDALSRAMDMGKGLLSRLASGV